MPHAFADVICSCNKNMKYHCSNFYDNNGYLEDFICPHFRISVLRKVQRGWLIGFDQLAGLYFDVICLNCRNKKSFSYEAKTFGKENKSEQFKCCNNTLNFDFKWSH